MLVTDEVVLVAEGVIGNPRRDNAFKGVCETRGTRGPDFSGPPQPCISLLDYCVERDLDMEEVLEVLHRSDISFGLNDDTLVREERLCRLLGIEPPEYERYMISLGC
jgi:hypothetical protein